METCKKIGYEVYYVELFMVKHKPHTAAKV